MGRGCGEGVWGGGVGWGRGEGGVWRDVVGGWVGAGGLLPSPLFPPPRFNPILPPPSTPQVKHKLDADVARLFLVVFSHIPLCACLESKVRRQPQTVI